MKKTRTFETTNYWGAMAILTNYLDGAIADYENGSVDNDLLIEHSINALELLEATILGGSAQEYRKRLNKAREQRKGVR